MTTSYCRLFFVCLGFGLVLLSVFSAILPPPSETPNVHIVSKVGFGWCCATLQKKCLFLLGKLEETPTCNYGWSTGVFAGPRTPSEIKPYQELTLGNSLNKAGYESLISVGVCGRGG